MNHLEILIGLLRLFMAVPDLCRRLGRPALAFPVCVVFGLALGRVASSGVKMMLHELEAKPTQLYRATPGAAR